MNVVFLVLFMIMVMVGLGIIILPKFIIVLKDLLNGEIK